MVFGWKITLFLFLMSSFFFNMTNDSFIATAIVQAIKKNKKETVKRLWMEEWLKKSDERKLSSPIDFLNFLRMDEDTYEELLNLVGPKIQKQGTKMCDAVSPNQRLSIILRILATDNSFSETCVMETCGEITKNLKYNIKAIKTNY